MSAALTIYRALTCNFCQRAEIALHRKGIAYEAVEIDLIDRPDWYRAKATGGSVPLLEDGEAPVHPSGVINEYIEERWPEPPMLPADPLARAATRRFIHRWDDGPCPAYERRLMNVRPEREEPLQQALDAALDDLERTLAEHGYDGAYWDGATIGLADATAAPMFVRLAGMRHFHGFDVPERCGRVRAWRDVLMTDASVVATSPKEPDLIAEYARYRGILERAAAAGFDPPVTSRD